MKNRAFENNDSKNDKVIFCIECGNELENISLSNKFNGKLTCVREKFAQCKKNGKFKGELCSKLFIFCDDNLEDLFL